MPMKVAISTSLVVILCAGVAQAEVPTPECPPPAPAAAAVSPAPVVPPPPPVTPVSYETSRTVLGPEPVPYGAADEPIESYLDLAPRNAFELGFQGGYAQPFGDVMSGFDISDLVDPGGEVALDLGWRISPVYMVGVSGRFHESVVDDNFGEN